MQVKRLYFIDAVRAFAILMMLQGHFIDTLIDPIYRDPSNSIFNIWNYFRGITAPIFFTISGLVFTYLLLRANKKGNDKPRIKKGLLRGLILILIGYSLRANILNWMYGSFSSYFLIIDVLQCIGLSLIIMVLLHVLFKWNTYLFSTILFFIASICFLSEPLYRNLTITNIPEFLVNYLTKQNGSVFTILPWFGYSASGALLATIFFKHVHKKHFKVITITLLFCVGYLLIYYSTPVLRKISLITDIELFKLSANYNYLFTRLGNVFIIFGIFYLLEQFMKQSIVVKIGEKTLSIYVIHFMILFGSYTGYGLKRFFDASLNPTEVIFGAILFMITSCFISFHYAKTNTFVYNLIRRLTNKFKR